MRITGISLLDDNYAWILRPEDGSACAVVDPSECEPIRNYLLGEGLALGWILATHHHQDHVGGIPDLADVTGRPRVLCSRADGERLPDVNKFVANGEEMMVAGSKLTVMLVPGHTNGSVAWHFPDIKAVFTGDTLFTGGCGRLFEASAEKMYDSLLRLRALPEETRIYCGHEYTTKNLKFALEVEPNNTKARERLGNEELRRAQEEPTVPARLGLEKLTNPFLRADDPSLMDRLGTKSPLETFKTLRKMRDAF